MMILPIIKEKENNDIIVATIHLFLLYFLLFPEGNVLVPPHLIQSPQMAKISMSSPITLPQNETSQLRIRWPGGLNRSPFSRNCQRWLAMYMLFLQLGQESKESSVYREETKSDH